MDLVQGIHLEKNIFQQKIPTVIILFFSFVKKVFSISCLIVGPKTAILIPVLTKPPMAPLLAPSSKNMGLAQLWQILVQNWQLIQEEVH